LAIPKLETLLAALVQIDSVNPSLVPGGAGEAVIASYLQQLLQDLPARVECLEATPGRPTIVATLPGTGGGRSLMWNAHTDTVGIDNMRDPFSGRIENGWLYGRGSYDMKASLAAALLAFARVASEGPLAGDLVLAAVADEEYASLGTEELLAYIRTDAAVVCEPTALDLCVAHKGFAWFEIETRGVAAHGSRPDLGVDANLAMGPVLERLRRHATELAAGRKHPLLGAASLHAAHIQGGSGWSTYSDGCRLRVERRTIPGESLQDVEADIRVAAAGEHCRLVFSRPAYEARPDSPLAAITLNALASARGARPSVTGQTPWFDSALIAAAGIDTVIAGPRGEGAHAAVERVELESVHQFEEALVQMARAYCR
jgi:acetylornithine deacetylase